MSTENQGGRTTADAERFAFYVREIAPYLAIIAEASSMRGMPFACAIQWAPDQVETLVHVPAAEAMDDDCTITMGFATAVSRAIYRPLWRRMAAAGNPGPLALDNEDRPHVH